tara:strand:+ start:6039 stop:7100 length:1062 start_codon:yes stop_codon:yes gene_type:complete
MHKKKEIEFIFQSLFHKNRELPFLSKQEEEKIYYKISQFFLTGFILDNVCLKSQYPSLHSKLSALNQNFLMRKLLMLNDLADIEKEFSKRKINHILLKGAAYDRINLHKDNQRHFRDIDILVKEDDLRKAVNILSSLGYRNENQYSLTRLKYIPQNHQMPVLINKNKTQIDLHFRITKPDIYKRCPLTDDFFKNYEIHTKTPDINSLVSHAMYHALQHHEQNQGPLFIFDILELIKASKASEIPLDISNELNLSIQYKMLIEFANHTNKKEFLDFESYSLLKELSNNFLWEEAPEDKFFIFSKTDKNKKNLNFKIIFNKLNNIKYTYQIDFFSFRFVLVLFKEFFNSLKKIRL